MLHGQSHGDALGPHNQFGLLEVFSATSGLKADKLVQKLEVNPADRSEISLGEKGNEWGAALFFNIFKCTTQIGSGKKNKQTDINALNTKLWLLLNCI